jgi:hypothetical protein
VDALADVFSIAAIAGRECRQQLDERRVRRLFQPEVGQKMGWSREKQRLNFRLVEPGQVGPVLLE